MDAPYGLGFLRGARLAALVQRLRAGEDAAQPDRPVDVRRLAGGVPPPRHRSTRASCSSSARTRASATAATTPPTRFKRFGDDPTRTLVVVDPRETETTRGAQRHLRVRPGTDVYLLLGMAATIVRDGPRSTRRSSRDQTRRLRGAARRARRRRRRRDGGALRARRGGADRGDRTRLRRAPSRRRSSTTSASSRRPSRP